jgi:uncharacterized protein
MKIKIEKADKNDFLIVKKQCSNEDFSIYGVASRCPNGFPQVVVLDPVLKEKNEINNSSLSNLLWLTCPEMREKIYTLEKNGMVNRAQALLHKDRSLASMMGDAHAHFYFLRKEVFMQSTGRDYLEPEFRMFDSGISGIRDVRVVKCLHMHYAHYKLCSSNIVGRSVEGIIGGASYCGCEECRCRL